MAHFINADKFLSENAEFADRDFNHPRYDVTLRDLVEDAPGIDVVRCAECTKKGTEKCPMKAWNYTRGEYEYFNVDDDFCSWGDTERSVSDDK